MFDRTSPFIMCKSNAFYCFRQNGSVKLQGGSTRPVFIRKGRNVSEIGISPILYMVIRINSIFNKATLKNLYKL